MSEKREKAYGIYVNGAFAFQIEKTKREAELIACAWHCPGMKGAKRTELDATFRLRGVRVVPVTIIPSAPTSWPDGGKP